MIGLGRQVLFARDLKKVWVDGERKIEIAIESLELCAGNFVAITGASGSGKSTVLDMLSLALRPETGGTLQINERGEMRDVRSLVDKQDEGALAELRANVFGYVVQTSELLPFLTGLENCLLQQKIAQRGTRDDIFILAKALDVELLLDVFPGALSVGQRQRVAIVRALCCLPPIVLADEPTAAQDPHLKDKVIEVLANAAARGTAVVMVNHDTALVERHRITSIRNTANASGKNWNSRFSDDRIAS